jgi:hypothetical protein
LGVLIYGIAEASTAYLITKITDPPPNPAHSEGFAESQQKWKNKHEFLKLHLSNLDASSKPTIDADQNPLSTGMSTEGEGTSSGGTLMNTGVTVISAGNSSSSALPTEPPPPYTEFSGR